MALIAPFRGLRYNLAKISKLEDVVTPPYDVIDDKAQLAFAKKNPFNMINLDLSKTVHGDAMAESRYTTAKATLEQWLAEGILQRDPEPAIYLYFTAYRLPSGEEFTRKGLVTQIELAEFAEGIVKPHEKTFRSVTTDRLRLLDTCQTQFSQIFSLYPDAQGEVMACLEKACPPAPLASVVDQDGCRHTLWAVTDPAALAEVARLFAGKAVYIADGHHRYTTALQWRELIRARQGEVAADSPYNHTMMYLCPMEDPGLSVLPTHRLLRMPAVLTPEELVAKLAPGFEVEEIPGGSREILVAELLARMDENRGVKTMFGAYLAEDDRGFLLTLRPGVMAATFGDQQPASLQQLDVVVLSELVITELLGISHQQLEAGNLLDYFSDPDEAVDVAVKEANSAEGGSPVLFLMNSTLVRQVKEVADEKLVMPHKSTFFYPKLITGLLMNQIVAGEKVMKPGR